MIPRYAGAEELAENVFFAGSAEREFLCARNDRPHRSQGVQSGILV
jgi:hypothetical protein